MLILTRRVGEAIHIGADITVVVLSVKGNQVRIGTEAPADVPVHREEIVEQVRRDLRPAQPAAVAGRTL